MKRNMHYDYTVVFFTNIQLLLYLMPILSSAEISPAMLLIKGEYTSLIYSNSLSNDPTIKETTNPRLVIIGHKQYCIKVVELLKTIGTSSIIGNDLLFRILDLKHTVIIIQPTIVRELPLFMYNSVIERATYYVIPFDIAEASKPLDKKNGFHGEIIKGCPEAVLAHELEHVLFDTYLNGYTYLLANFMSKNHTNIHCSEVLAVRTENAVRISLNLKPRTLYNNIRIFPKGLMIHPKFPRTMYMIDEVNLNFLDRYGRRYVIRRKGLETDDIGHFKLFNKFLASEYKVHKKNGIEVKAINLQIAGS